MKLNEKIKNLPNSPGVYIMKDEIDSVIYVGKSKNLKSRVSTYFQNSNTHSKKVVRLVRSISDFDYITTDTEFEAFMLECTLIKKFKPHYNKLMKNTRTYCYIKMKLSENYPYLVFSVESSKESDDLYFGPLNSRRKAREAILALREYFKILCTNSANSGSECLNYSLGFCRGVCTDEVTSEEYEEIIFKIVNLFNGTDETVINDLKFKMDSQAKDLNFETALKYRNYIDAINYVINKLKIINYTKQNNKIAVVEYLSDIEFKFFLIEGNKIHFKQKYNLDYYSIETIKTILTDKIKLIFSNSINTNIDIGPEDLDEAQIIYMYLQNKCNNIKCIAVTDECLSCELNDLLN